MAFLLGPLGRYAIGAVAAIAALWFVYNTVYNKGAEQVRTRIEKENTDARNKADEGRIRSERESDSGELRKDDGFRRD